MRAREIKRASSPLTLQTQDGTFSGYASLFGVVDLGKDQVARGAFRRSLSNRKPADVRMLYQHDPAYPIGAWSTVREDATGLFVEGRIDIGSEKGREVLSLLRSGSIDGLSIGFKTGRSRTDRATGIRTILEADLWEVSVVTFPMLTAARVAQVKAAPPIEALPTRRTFERWLTQDAGLSRSQARTIIAKGFTHLEGKQDAAPSSDMAARFRAMAARLSAK
ncbi:MAG: HK97 family phage prohead protease [Pseudomonadota bacterium]